MEQQIIIASKLYRCRATAKSLHGDKFHEKIYPYQEILNVINKKNNEGVLRAVLTACRLESVADNEYAQLMFMAAGVELLEPSI